MSWSCLILALRLTKAVVIYKHMKRTLFLVSAILAALMTLGGASVVIHQVAAADGLKSSVIAFVIALGFALLGPTFLAAVLFFRRQVDSRPLHPGRLQHPTKHTPGLRAEPHLGGH